MSVMVPDKILHMYEMFVSCPRVQTFEKLTIYEFISVSIATLLHHNQQEA